MPSGRRNAASRNGQTKSQTGFSGSTNTAIRSNSGERIAGSGGDDKKSEDFCGIKTLVPKHVPIPIVPVDGHLTFETLSLIVSIIAASLQMLNLYRTVWWLPHSYNNYSMNFYLIDPYLLIFIVTMIARQFIYSLLRQFIDISSPVHWLSAAQKIMRIILLIIVMSILCWCLYHMAERHNSMKIFYLCYPSLSVYFVMFGMSVAPFFDISTATLSSKDDKKTKYLLDKPLHNCSLNASAIRAEVSTLRSDFNRRLKRALFASSSSAYICGIAPIIFVPQHLHFNVSWVVQHVIMFWIGMCFYKTDEYPLFRYCDVLHRAALHLGRWVKIENRNNHTYAQTWNDSVLWPHGSIVRHNKETYRSEGLCTVAEPGNSNHYRFYALFNNPTMLLCSLLGLQLLLVGAQLFILLRSNDWYQVLSITLLLLINYYPLFKITRDYLICWKVYHAEQIIQEKSQMCSNPVVQ
ncbi:PREDICTED: LOW QUALITY PROTEIN: transmembrane protein 39A [Dufourea novaeangliae]|uniref:LOW QUALITY PROTEIN: transmembrane protein 39A n=1 Tax=Dufourea novaeangliae TaxID=178035 RepID=UPI000767607A|nr:PREDICTED: LOW QUALITY PROTEIN: transmembrane protein 39A [Dufourea novaeangliae]